MLFSEPKIPQFVQFFRRLVASVVSVLFSEPKIPQFIGHINPARAVDRVSVLFSEPKIPQSGAGWWNRTTTTVSVLFSEPKIPQSQTGGDGQMMHAGFSALQRAENSSILCRGACVVIERRVSVLFSEPKIPQWSGAHRRRR